MQAMPQAQASLSFFQLKLHCLLHIQRGVKGLFACKHFLLAETFMREARLNRFFLHQMCNKRDGNVSENSCHTLFMVTLVLLGLSTQFENWYIVGKPLQHIGRNQDSLRLCLAATSS